MEKLGKFIKNCWRPETEEWEIIDANGQPHNYGPNKTESGDIHETVQAENDGENKPIVDIKDVYGEFILEAQDAWYKSLNSLILRVRESQTSLADSIDTLASSNVGNAALIGKKIFRHGSSSDDIHKFFFELDPKRCGLPVNQNKCSPSPFTATLKTVKQNSQATVQQTRGTGYASNNVLSSDVVLSEQDRALYKRVLQCANYPVLGSPSSEPLVTPCASARSSHSKTIDGKHSVTSNDATSVMSPTDAISIDPDMMMKLLRESFGINQRTHERYYAEIKKSIPHRDPSKLLLHELQDRLYRLETNSDNYYRVNSFINPAGYSKWRTREITNTKVLIRRFWKKEMPRNLGMGVGQVNAQKEYMILQNKLFEYEMKTRRELNLDSVEDHALSVLPISTAARKLLKEFGLRYGVCSLFRQIAALVCMAEKFENAGWFIKFATRAVFQVDKILKSCDLIVEDEREMLEHALEILHCNVEYTFKKIRKLCPSKIQFDTISWILEMLTAIIKIKEYLGLLDESDSTLQTLVRGYIEEAVYEGYNKCKDLAIIDNESCPYSGGTTPKILITLLHDIRKEFKFYEELGRKCSDLNRYFDVAYVVANKLYGLCMKDIRELMVRRTQTIVTAEIDVAVLKLAYRLAKLDKDWASFVSQRSQKWRVDFMLEMHVTMTAIKEFACKQIRSFLTKDNWKTISFSCTEAAPDSSRGQSREQARERVNTIISLGSVVQSEGSAFAKPRPAEKPCVVDDAKSKTEHEHTSFNIGSADKVLPERISSNKSLLEAVIEENKFVSQAKSTETSLVGKVAEENHRGLNTDPQQQIINENTSQLGVDAAEDKRTGENLETFPKTAFDVNRNTYIEKSEENLVISNGEGDDPCKTLHDDIEQYIRALLDDILLHVDRVEDFKIDLYIKKVLDVSLQTVRNEPIRKDSERSSCNNNGHVDGMLQAVEQRLNASLEHDQNALAADARGECDGKTEPLEDFDSEVANMLRNSKCSFGTRLYDAAEREYASDDEDSIDTNELKKPYQKVSEMMPGRDCGTDNGPIKIPTLKRIDAGETPESEFTAVEQGDAGDMIGNDNRIPNPTRANSATVTKSFSLPACDFVSLRQKALRTDMQKSKSDQSMLDAYDAQDAEDAFVSSVQEKENTFVSQLSTNLQTKPRESEPGSRPDSGTREKKSAKVELPKEGRILVSSSLIDVLTIVLRTSGFYSQLCDILAPSKVRSNAQNREAKPPSEIIRDNFAFGLVTNIRDLLTTYGDALLALDICGLDDDVVNETLGSELYLRLKNKQNEGFIGGCRHDLNRRMSMNAVREGTYSEYCPKVSKIIRYCIGEWEAITPEMCTRINDTRSLINLLPLIEDKSKEMCFGNDDGAASGHDGRINWPGSHTQDGLCPPLATCKKNLQIIWLSQTRILAHRIAFMLEKIVEILLSLSLKWTFKAPYKEQMKPISVFLDHQMKTLRQHLCPVSVQSVVKALWNKVILILHDYAKDLRMNKTDPKYNAERYIQLISVLLRHLVVDNETGDNLLNRCRAVLLRFRLHSLPSAKLKIISEISRNLEAESGNLLRSLTPKEILLDIKTSRLLPKIFSGANFVDILMNNEIWLHEFSFSLGLKKSDDRTMAISVGKALYRSQLIVCVETPDQVQEPNVRRIISPTQRNSKRVRIGSKTISLSHVANANSEDGSLDQLEDEEDEEEERFHEDGDYLYTVSTKYCNESDLLVEVWRIFRQAGNAGAEFAHVIHSDVVSVLEYRAFWKRDKYSENILKSVAPKTMRAKAFSCPWF